jgi:serine/threonine protein phosphatase PrpC
VVESEGMELKAGFVCDRGLNPKRPVNQDRFLAIPERGLFAVFDGVGGQRAGEVASQTAAETIEEALAHTPAQSSADLIRRAIQFANRDIFEMAEGDPAYKTMATTIALIHFDGDRATIAHVGDSRVYRLEDGRFYRETIDHTDLEDALRAGKISRAEAARRQEGNVINRALGVEPDVEVEIKTISLRGGSRFLLCSDGVYKHLSDAEIARVLALSDDPQSSAEELKRIVHERGADDNLTAVIVYAGRAAESTSAERKSERKVEVAAVSPRLGASAPVREGAQGGRIQVNFGGAAEGGPLSAEDRRANVWDSSRGRSLDVTERARSRSASRKVMYTLLVMVLVAGAFYGGLRAPEWLDKPAPAGSVKDSLQMGREAFEAGNYQTASAELESLVGREPQNARAHYWLGRARLEMGDYGRAAQNFEDALRLQPAMRDALVQAAAAFEADGKRDKADRLLRQYGETRRAERANGNANR